jgi:hypothetical protein
VVLSEELCLAERCAAAGEERLGLRDEPRRAYAAVEVERTLDLAHAFVDAALTEKLPPGTDAEVRLGSR